MNEKYLHNIVLYVSDPDVVTEFTTECSPEVAGMIRIKGNYPDALYVCDSEQVASTLLTLGFPVCALLHPGNDGLRFDGVGYVIENPSMISVDDYERIYRRLAGIPWDILETDRLLLRETTINDLDRLHELYDDPEIRNFIEPLFDRISEKDYQQNYIDKIYGFFNIGIWSMIRKSDNLMIGRAGIEYTDMAGVAELGFLVGDGYRRQGYAYEATSAIIRYASQIEDVDSVRARIRLDNEPSRKLCEKLGMRSTRELNDNLVEWVIDV